MAIGMGSVSPPGKAVIGRAWSRKSVEPEIAHSMS
jgi:hypothetical protein